MKKLFGTVFASLVCLSLTVSANSGWDWGYFFSTDNRPESLCSEKVNVVGVLDLSPKLGNADSDDVLKKARDIVYKMFINSGKVYPSNDSDLNTSDRIRKDIEDTQKRIRDDIENTQKRIRDDINSSFDFDRERKIVCKTKVIAVITTVEVPVYEDDNNQLLI